MHVIDLFEVTKFSTRVNLVPDRENDFEFKLDEVEKSISYEEPFT